MKRDPSSGPGRSKGARDQPRPRWGPQDPWPTADGYRLSLLASIQTAEDVDLLDFFRKVYPEALPLPVDDSTEEAEGASPSRQGSPRLEDG